MNERWRYRAANASGATVEGEIDASSEAGAVDALRERALWATDVWPASEGQSAFRKSPKVPAGVLAASTRAIAVLLESGVTLDRALEYAAQQTTDDALRNALNALRRDVRSGRSLADALKSQPVFPSLYPALVATGEATGTLDNALTRLAEHVEQREAFMARLRAALLYPALLGSAAIVGVTIILLVVVPRFAVLLEQAGAPLPLSTRMLLAGNVIVTRGWPVWLLLMGVAVLFWRRAEASTENKQRWHARRLTWPIVGKLEREVAAARYTRTLSLALPSGVGLLEAMALARQTVSNASLAARLEASERRVQSGALLGESLGDALPPLARQLLDAGETSGTLAQMASRSADAFDAEVERSLAKLMTLVEPVLILGFGGIIGFVALGLLQAIYGMNASVL